MITKVVDDDDDDDDGDVVIFPLEELPTFTRISRKQFFIPHSVSSSVLEIRVTFQHDCSKPTQLLLSVLILHFLDLQEKKKVCSGRFFDVWLEESLFLCLMFMFSSSSTSVSSSSSSSSSSVSAAEATKYSGAQQEVVVVHANASALAAYTLGRRFDETSLACNLKSYKSAFQ